MENSERRNFISAMILYGGMNPELIIRMIEKNDVDRIDYRLGGISIFREEEFIVAEVDNKYIANKPMTYRWNKDEAGN